MLMSAVMNPYKATLGVMDAQVWPKMLGLMAVTLGGTAGATVTLEERGGDRQ